jgi:hypothetical protein
MKRFYTNYNEFYQLHEFLLIINQTNFVFLLKKANLRKKIRVIRKIRHNSCKMCLIQPIIRINNILK